MHSDNYMYILLYTVESVAHVKSKALLETTATLMSKGNSNAKGKTRCTVECVWHHG